MRVLLYLSKHHFKNELQRNGGMAPIDTKSLMVLRRGKIERALRCIRSKVELKSTLYFVVLPKLLPYSGCCLNSENQSFWKN
jgi:hypothetical protein